MPRVLVLGSVSYNLMLYTVSPTSLMFFLSCAYFLLMLRSYTQDEGKYLLSHILRR